MVFGLVGRYLVFSFIVVYLKCSSLLGLVLGLLSLPGVERERLSLSVLCGGTRPVPSELYFEEGIIFHQIGNIVTTNLLPRNTLYNLTYSAVSAALYLILQRS